MFEFAFGAASRWSNSTNKPKSVLHPTERSSTTLGIRQLLMVISPVLSGELSELWLLITN